MAARSYRPALPCPARPPHPRAGLCLALCTRRRPALRARTRREGVRGARGVAESPRTSSAGKGLPERQLLLSPFSNLHTSTDSFLQFVIPCSSAFEH